MSDVDILKSFSRHSIGSWICDRDVTVLGKAISKGEVISAYGNHPDVFSHLERLLRQYGAGTRG
ncbi:MAG: hypothetical protein AB3N20_12785 [Rhizobiaceae bacterium]